MKFLIAPMAASAEVSGPYMRAAALAEAFLRRGHEVAFCAALGENFAGAPGIPNFRSPVPTARSKRPFSSAGIKHTPSFDEVLHLSGATDYAFFKADVACLCAAIQIFEPDVIYSEFRPAAVVAAKQEMVSVLASYSYPIQTMETDGQFCAGVNAVLRELGQEETPSTAALLRRADLRIIPSVRELDPVYGEDVLFAGPFKRLEPVFSQTPRDKIVVYLGTEANRAQKQLRVLQKCFGKSPYEVYASGRALPVGVRGNLHTGERFDFAELLPQSVVLINHGGQKSIMDCLCCGTPQIIFPGASFERRYHTESLVSAGVALPLETKEFTPQKLVACVKQITTDPAFSARAQALGQALCRPSGAELVADLLEKAQ